MCLQGEKEVKCTGSCGSDIVVICSVSINYFHVHSADPKNYGTFIVEGFDFSHLLKLSQ